MSYEILGRNFSTDKEEVVKTVEEFSELVPAILRLMKLNPDYRYDWREVNDNRNEI